MEYEIYRVDELYHHGIRGMKWGIRRYQNKDGTLTDAGKKRLKKEQDAVRKQEQIMKNRLETQAKFEKVAARRQVIEEQKRSLGDYDKQDRRNAKRAERKAVREMKRLAKKAANKSVDEMTDAELSATINRIRLEQQYAALTATPEKNNRGAKYANDFMDKSVMPAVQEAGKTLLRDSLLKAGKKYLGLDPKDTDDYLTKLEKDNRKMRAENTNEQLKRQRAEAARKAQQATQDSYTDTTSDNPTREDTSRNDSRVINGFSRSSSGVWTPVDEPVSRLTTTKNVRKGRKRFRDYMFEVDDD